MIKNILIVDDMPLEQNNMTSLLQESGSYHVEVSNSGEEALKKLESFHPDLIFMDIVMPGMDGFHACRKIINNEKTRDIPVVFVSSKHQEADKIWGKLQGAKGHIGKPYRQEEILSTIKQIETSVH